MIWVNEGLQALIACGQVPNPLSKKREKDLDLAKYHIGVLEVLEEKTKGNLTEEEGRALRELLHESRMAYLDAASGKKTAG